MTAPITDTAIVVFGLPTNDDGTPSARQMWRVEEGIRCVSAYDAACIVFTGGAVRNEFVEAETMAGYAQTHGLARQLIRTETAATDTWENIALVHPMIGGAAKVVIVANVFHARRARGYWLRQFPDEAARVVIDPALGRREPWSRRPVSFLYNTAASVRDVIMRRFSK